MMRYYQQLIRVRRAYDVFRTVNSAVTANQLDNGRAVITIDNHVGEKALVIANPTAEAMTYQVVGSWNMVINGVDVIEGDPIPTQGEITVPAYSAVVLVNDNCINQ